MLDLSEVSAVEIAERVRSGKTKAVEVAKSSLARIESLNPRLRAFIAVTAEQAMRDAESVDIDVARGKLLPLAGVPIAIKDGFDVRGSRTTFGSRALDDAPPAERDATVVARLKAAGCVVVGKASLHEFAFGFTGENPRFGDCRNPWNLDRIPGGSSSGCGAALAAGMVLGAVGGDTGGSIRMPASLCGVVGLKTTYGRVSRQGGMALSWSMDTVGPMARSVGDAAALLDVMAGPDPLDPTTRADRPRGFRDGLGDKDLKGLRIGVPHVHFLEALEPDVADASQEAIRVLKSLGATILDVNFPAIDPIRAAHRAIIFSEAAAAHETIVRTRGDRIGADILPLLVAGHAITATQYLAAQQARRAIVSEVRAVWKRIDVLLTPTCPITAVPFKTTTARLNGEERPLVRVFLDQLLPFNLTGQPALTIPCGYSKSGLPIGLQLVGKAWDEARLLKTGATYETTSGLERRRPTI